METHSPGWRQSRAVANRQRGDINQTKVTTTTGWEKPGKLEQQAGLVFLAGFEDNRLYRGRRYWLVSSSIVSRISWIGECLNQVQSTPKDPLSRQRFGHVRRTARKPAITAKFLVIVPCKGAAMANQG
uniref:(northern house mosquito) hypothetical protein n=1 Tax=Culex pipiens TaxID=7175 RepID=A0A8D8AU44_CULPI